MFRPSPTADHGSILADPTGAAARGATGHAFIQADSAGAAWDAKLQQGSPLIVVPREEQLTTSLSVSSRNQESSRGEVRKKKQEINDVTHKTSASHFFYPF